jgi:hypothetical protein
MNEPSSTEPTAEALAATDKFISENAEHITFAAEANGVRPRTWLQVFREIHIVDPQGAKYLLERHSKPPTPAAEEQPLAVTAEEGHA